MDKSWINLHRLDVRYIQGVIEFIKFACDNMQTGLTEIVCLCKKCRNVRLAKIDVVKEHLIVNDFLPTYTRWIFHGEQSIPIYYGHENIGQSSGGDDIGQGSGDDDEMREILHDAFGIFPPSSVCDVGDPHMTSRKDPDEGTKNVFNLLKEVERQLYPGCQKYSLLSFIIRLMHIKYLNGWSNKSFTMLLKLLKDVLPEGETVPDSFSASRTLLKGLGLDYHKVHVCPKDCMLYWGDDFERINCKVCLTRVYILAFITPICSGSCDSILTFITRRSPGSAGSCQEENENCTIWHS